MPDQPPSEQHPNGPRTLGTVLRDNVPMRPPMLERLIAIEAGRHPTLTELREALGLDLSLPPAWDVARAEWPSASAPADEELSALLDAMYRSLTSTRRIDGRFDATGLSATRVAEPVRIREGDDLILLAFADNRTERGVEFSAEARGEGIRGHIEAGRTGSALLNAGPMPAGSFLLPVMLVADGRPYTIDLPIESAPAGTLSVRIFDEATGGRVAARVYLLDVTGAAWPAGATIRRDRHGNAFFHADGSFSARVGRQARLVVLRGIEYEPYEATIDVAPDAEVNIDVRLRRWTDMAREGWRSADVHVHLHYGGEYLLSPDDAALVQRAEDVHFLNMMVANQGSGWVHDREHFEGKPHALSTPEYLLQWGEEYRNNFYGHMCMYGIRELVPPIYSGFPRSEHAHDLPANADAADHCHSVGGTLSYAHPMFDSGDLDRVFRDEDVHSVEAKELPVDAALGKIDALDVMSYPGDELETSKLWYRLLNCGLRLSATAGTDTFMNTCDQGEFSNPPAGDRVYAQIDGEFTVDSWCEVVRAGRTFVTNGPMLSLIVQGEPIGTTVEAHAGTALHIVGEARSYAPMDRIELIVNGDVAVTMPASEDGRHARIEHELNPAESCWVALRALGPEHPAVLDDHLFAHTSPVYVSVDGTPIGVPADAAYFVEWIERLIALSERHGRYPDDESRDRVVALFREGQQYYQQRL